MSDALQLLSSAPTWALTLADLRALEAALELASTLSQDSLAVLRERADRKRRPPRRRNRTALLTISGFLTHRGDPFGLSTSTADLARIIRELTADRDVSTLVLDIVSPGGSTAGVEELADAVYQSGKSVRVFAVANALAASGAYWVASQAHSVVASPSALVGSIGVVGTHVDLSEKARREGVAVTVITAGRYKAEGSEFVPLTDAGRRHLRALVSDRYLAFTRDVARGRGVPVARVRSGFGEGRLLPAKEALRLGLVDDVATLDEVLSQSLGASTPRRPRPRPRGSHTLNRRAALVQLHTIGQRHLAEDIAALERTRAQ